MPDNGLVTAAAADYLETRHHELRKTRMLMVDGNLTTNLLSAEGGVSARVHLGGYWGFAAMPGTGSPTQRVQVEQDARSNALAIRSFGQRSTLTLAGDGYVGAHVFKGNDLLTPAQCNERLQTLHAYCRRRYPGLRSTRLLLADENHDKHLSTSRGADVHSSIRRAMCYIMFMVEAEDGSPLELTHDVSGKGSVADLDLEHDVTHRAPDA